MRPNGGVRGAAFLRCNGRSGHSYRYYFVLLGTALLALMSCSAILASVKRPCLQEQFEAQAKQLVRLVTVSEERLQTLPKILHAVEDTLNNVWPGCKASLLGSLAVGVGSPSSDADIAVELPHGQYTTDNDVINRATTAFDNSPNYEQINVIKSERISVINLYYIPGNIFCDISFKTVVAPYETELLKYLLNSDERVLKMAIILKHWAKIHNLTIKNCQSSLNILLLVIFFLQQRTILPPVIELQRNVKENILNCSEHYNVAFERKPILSENNESLDLLLRHFFEFYADFNFDKYIVSTFIGRALERKTFENVESVPDDFHLYKINVENKIIYPLNINTALCIQSPLTPNNNCASKVDTELKKRMQFYFKTAANLYRQNNMCSFLNGILNDIY